MEGVVGGGEGKSGSFSYTVILHSPGLSRELFAILGASTTVRRKKQKRMAEIEVIAVAAKSPMKQHHYS